MAQIAITTSYSFLTSTILISDLVEKAKEKGVKTLGITDINMHGAFQFFSRCKAEGIKPIIGLKVTCLYGELLVYAKNLDGYYKLLKLSSNIEWKTLEIDDYLLDPDLIIILQMDKQTSIAEIPDGIKYVGLDLTDFDFEINYAQDKVLACDKYNKKVVATPRVNYLEPQDQRYLDALVAIKNGTKVEGESSNFGSNFLRKTSELKEMYAEYHNALVELGKIIESIDIDIPFGSYVTSKFPTEHDPLDLLVALSRKGLVKRLEGLEVNRNLYEERLNRELLVIKDLGYIDYFLTVYDLVNYAKSNDIFVGPGRGSSAGSLVAYCLGITNADPIKYDLLFERFLNPDRSTMPDIDLDFPDDKRDQVIKYAVEKYGKENVASIVTFGTFQGRSAIRDVAKVLGLPDTYLSEIMKYVPVNTKSIVPLLENEKLKHLYDTYSEITQVLDYAVKIERIPRHSSTHAAGIIICDKELVNYTALQPGLFEMNQTQYSMNDLEEIGLAKIDFLGLSNLKIIKRTVDLIKKYEGIDIPLYDMKFDDPKVFQILTNRETDGVFQLESMGIRNALNKVRVDSFEDIVAVLALYRPGPMENIDEYSERKRGKKFEYLHPDLEAILAPTYGIIIYQEQIIMIANQFAGYTLAEADILRRAVSKKYKRLLEEEKVRFIEKCTIERYNNTVASQIYDYILKFANYGFNRSHTVAYAMIAYISAYLKVYYPIYFFSVLLSNSIGSDKNLSKYLKECRKHSIEIVLPNINKAHVNFLTGKNSIMIPFSAIKNVGSTIARKIVEERRNKQFETYLDFCVRTKDFVNKKVAEQLINAGALDSFKLTRKSMIEQYEDVIKFAEYGALLDSSEFLYKEIAEYSEDELSERERLAFGINVTNHVLSKYEDQIKNQGLLSIDEYLELGSGNILAQVVRSKEITTKKGDKMAFVTLEDQISELEIVVFPKEYETYKELLQVKNVLIFNLTKQNRQDKDSFILNKVVRI